MAWDPPKNPEQLPAGWQATSTERGPIRPFWIWSALAAVVIVVVIVVTAARGGGESDDGTDAVVACQLAVEDALKAPSTAEHPRPSHVTPLEQLDGSWRVASYVDAENGFGAMIRTHYTCTTYRVAGGWRVESLDVTD